MDGYRIARFRRIALALIGGRRDDRMGQRPVFSRQPLLIGGERCRAVLVAMRRPGIDIARETGKGDVKIIGRPSHQPDRIFGDFLQAIVPAQQIVLRVRHDMAQIDGLSRFGIGEQAAIGIVVLKIEYRRQRMRGARKAWVIDNVGDARAVHPYFAWAPQPCEELFSGACGHLSNP